jgi:hypothetical protein
VCFSEIKWLYEYLTTPLRGGRLACELLDIAVEMSPVLFLSYMFPPSAFESVLRIIAVFFQKEREDDNSAGRYSF